MQRTNAYTVLLLLAIVILSVTTSCQTTEVKDHILVVTTIYPYELIVGQLATDNIEVVSIIPANSSPHTYSPKPEDIKLLEDADLIITNGADLEAYLEKSMLLYADKRIDAYTLVDNVFYLEEMEQEQGHHHHELHQEHENGHHHHHINPHFWLDPLFVSRIGAEICEALIMIDPENDEKYRENFNKFNDDMQELNMKISSERRSLKDVSILNFHDAFYYFNNRYGIHSAGTIVSSPGKEKPLHNSI